MPHPVFAPSRSHLRCVLGGALAAALLVPVIPASAAQVTAATHDAATVTVDASSISVSATEVASGGSITVDHITDEPHDLNWIGVYRESDGAPDGSPGSIVWQYAPGETGSTTFALDGFAAGEYRVWFLARDGYVALTQPAALSVTAAPPVPGAPQLGDPDAAVEIDPVAPDPSTDEVLYREGFDRDAAARGGWTVELDASMADAGAGAYRGWSFTTRPEWAATVDEMRDRFGRSHDVFAVADAQQFGDRPFASTLISEPVAVAGSGAVRLTFDSHYRGAAGQTGVARVSFDGGPPVELLRLDETSVTNGYDGMELNAAHDVEVDVPAGAQQAVFSWELTGGAGARYWAVDSVAVHEVLLDPANDPTSAWVVSDIQGHPADLAHGLRDLSALSPDAAALLMVGDLVNSGTPAEWSEVDAVMAGSEGIRPELTVAAIGNHERYAAGGFEANRDRFLTFAQRDRVWDEYVLQGPGGDVPVIVLGQELAGPTDVPMSEEQVLFLQERLAHWTERDRQVVVLSHFPLGDTVSASWIPWYHEHHHQNDRLTSILGNYPNAIVLSGHTHYPAELGDWAVQRRTDDGSPDGFWAVNTLAMHVEWDAVGEDTTGVSEVVTRDVNRGLTLDSYGDRIVVTAHDFAADQQLRQVTIPNPLVASETVEAAPTIQSAKPTIVAEKGRIKPGAKLTVELGEWTPTPEFSYQWLADGRPIRRGTTDHIRLTGAHRGKAITVQVTGVLDGHPATTVESDPVRID